MYHFRSSAQVRVTFGLFVMVSVMSQNATLGCIIATLRTRPHATCIDNCLHLDMVAATFNSDETFARLCSISSNLEPRLRPSDQGIRTTQNPI